MSNQESNGLLVAGDLYIDRLDADGNSTGYMPVSNATQMALEQEIEFQDLTSRRKDTYGQTLATVPIPQPGEVNLTLDEINRQNLAIALLGEMEEINTSGETFTATEVTLKGYNWTPIGERSLKEEGFTVEKDATELTRGVDYEVNWAMGLIRAIKGSENVTEGDTVQVSGETNAMSGARIKGSVRPVVRAKLMLDGRNMVDNRRLIVTVDEATLRPTEAVDLLSEEFATLPMTGRMRTLSGKDAPYTVELLDHA